MKPPRILAVASAADLDFRYGCTPAWWQLWKGLYEAGCDLIVTPYRGRAVESPWWRTYPNPCYREGELFTRAGGPPGVWAETDQAGRRPAAGHGVRQGGADGHLTLGDPTLEASPRADHRAGGRRGRSDRLHGPHEPSPRDPDGAPRALRRPRRLLRRRPAGEPPRVRWAHTGFNIYHGADPGEYDLMISNSEGAIPSLVAMGARRAEALFWAVDPDLFAPLPVTKEHDVFFYGYGDRSAGTGWRTWSGNRAGGCRRSTSSSAGRTSVVTPARRARSATCPSTSSRTRSRRAGST